MVEEMMTIRMASYIDAIEIALLSRNEIEYGLEWGWTEKKVRRKISEKDTNVAVAKNGETLVGFGIMKYGDEKANLDLLAVKPAYRRRGVGSQIVQWLEEVAKTAGLFTVFIQARSQNLIALKFYTNIGYIEIQRVPGFYQHQEDGVILFKRIAGDKNET